MQLVVEAPSELGELLRVVVRQLDAGDSDVGVGWFLDSVEAPPPLPPPPPPPSPPPERAPL